jgi:hypothetical protein
MGHPMQTSADIEFMRALEKDFVQEHFGGVQDPAKYKIWYSGLGSSPVLFLGINPAGSTTNYLTASQPYEKWGHDFIEYECDPRYRLAAGAMRFLRRMVGGSREEADRFVRRIPVSNVCFVRKQNPRDLTDEDYEACKPYVERIIKRVDPLLVVTVGDRAFEQSAAILRSRARIIENPSRYVTTPNGSARAALYRSCDIEGCPARLRKIVRLAHLSKFGLGRDDDWEDAYACLDRDLEEAGLRPFALK